MKTLNKKRKITISIILLVLNIIFLIYLFSTEECRMQVTYKYRNQENYYLVIMDTQGNEESIKVGLSLFSNCKEQSYVYIKNHDFYQTIK